MKYSLLAVPLLISAGLHAQAPVPAGDQFQVNTSTFSQQMLASVAADAVGNFVVVWTSQQSQGDDDSGRAQPAGQYLTRLTCGQRVETWKMTMIK